MIVYSYKGLMNLENQRLNVATGALANFGNNEVPKYSISNFFVKPEFHGLYSYSY